MEDLKNQIINKSGFLIYTDYWEKYFSKMTGEQVKEVFKIIFNFNLTFEILKTNDLAIEMVVTTIIDNIKRDALKRTKQSIASAKNGKLGGRPKPQDNPKITPNKPQDNPKETPNITPNTNENNNLNNKPNTKEIHAVFENDFEELWKHYTPVVVNNGNFTNKGSKQTALKFYKKARAKFSHQTIMDCLEQYLKECQNNNRFTKNVASWLNQTMQDGFKTHEVVLINAEPPKPAFLTRQQQKEQDDLKVFSNFLNKYNGYDNA